ncbi:response regulator [Parvularcula sp. LCG005]|uniref:response regulator n=1 Tax=Parvularcula sp. LCG005 TaxID=3078805 RepID=UPI002943D3DE|nr:response regulator [Parvularcula sp. LCG005]WOI52506.1 response regulator [Parvularcula sp. LCG005]
MASGLNSILYVEDDEMIWEVTLMALRDLGGFEVVHCPSGAAALEVAETFEPQMILLDVMMPGMDGPETFRRLRKMPSIADVPIVFMTAKVQTHETAAYMAMGAAGVIPKPFDPMTIADDLRAIYADTAACPSSSGAGVSTAS